MMEAIAALILVLLAVDTAVLGYVLLYDRRWRIDARRIGGAIAANLLNEYGDDSAALSEDGTKRFARTRYLELCGALGLPETAVEAVIAEAWRIVGAARTEPAGMALYE